MQCIQKIIDAREQIDRGHVIAYPTEFCYGLGCDPFNQAAVRQLLTIKNRSVDKGLILLISAWSQLMPLITDTTNAMLEPVKASWPGPVTWVFKKSTRIPYCISGQHDSIAIRMSAHPVAQALSQQGPVVSTSANQTGQAPATSIAMLDAQFPEGLAGCLMGSLGTETSPSCIYDVRTQRRIR